MTGSRSGRIRECPNCAMEIPERSSVCPICRYEFPKRPVLPWKPVATLLLLLILAGILWQALRMFGR